MQHLAKPTELREEYEGMLDELVAMLGPHLPDNVRVFAHGRARRFGQRLADYAEIDEIIRTFRRNGLPTTKDHRAYQLITDFIKTYEARRDDPSAA